MKVKINGIEIEAEAGCQIDVAVDGSIKITAAPLLNFGFIGSSGQIRIVPTEFGIGSKQEVES